MQPFFAPEAFPPRTSRPSGMAWADGRLPKQVDVFALCHLLELADGRAATAPAASNHARTPVKRSRSTSDAESVGASSRPGPPPLAAMIAAQSVRFACGACIRLLAVKGDNMANKPDEIHGLHRECMHFMCCRYAGPREQAGAFGAMLRCNASVPSMLPHVRYVQPNYCAGTLNVFMEHCTAADGAVLLEALLDHAASLGRDLVTTWPTDWEDTPDSLLRRVVKSGNVEYLRVVLRRGLHVNSLTPTDVTQHAETNKWPVSDGVREVLAHYLA